MTDQLDTTDLGRRDSALDDGRASTVVARHGSLVVASAAMRCVLDAVDGVASTDLPILLVGETGVGKDIVARELHLRSVRAHAPFVEVHCAAIPNALIESELFGFEEGAFTGAHRTKLGKFELARGGTLVLHEITEIAPALQAKLLHVLQDGSFARIGGNEQLRADARIVCTSNRLLEQAVSEGRFRQDLLYRVQAFSIRVPPLHERRSEIPILFRHFLGIYAKRTRRPIPRPSGRLLDLLMRHSFPGNVRELENLACRLVVFGTEESVIDDLSRPKPHSATSHGGEVDALLDEFERTAGQVPLLEVRRQMVRAVERQVLISTLAATSSNRRQAAKLLSVSYSTLLDKIRACGVDVGAGLADAPAVLEAAP